MARLADLRPPPAARRRHLRIRRLPAGDGHGADHQGGCQLDEGGSRVGEGTAKARRREVELTRQALAEDVERFARRVRAELDWKARLRRDGPQIVAIAGVIAVVLVAGLALRHRLRSGGGDDDLLEGATV